MGVASEPTRPGAAPGTTTESEVAEPPAAVGSSGTLSLEVGRGSGTRPGRWRVPPARRRLLRWSF